MDLIKKIGAISFALALFFGVAVAISPVAKATGQHADIQSAFYVSTDNGVTWLPGESSICVEPGADLLVLYKVWNAGDLEVKSVTGYSTTENGQYIDENNIVDADQDGDGNSFVFGNGTDFTIANLGVNGSATDGYQGIITTANLASDIPCDSDIRGTVVLTRFSADESDGVRDVNFLIERALAAPITMNQISTFTVNVRNHICPEVCGGSTSVATVTTLPQTGSSIIDLVQSLF